MERFRLTWWAKDLDSIERLGRDVGRETPVAALCRARMPAVSVDSLSALLAAGHGPVTRLNGHTKLP
jgi:hypothetical protein